MENYVTPAENKNYYIYLKDLEDYWVEHFGQKDWDDADFNQIDMIIQQNDPELFYCDRGADDRGQYLLYTTNENNAR